MLVWQLQGTTKLGWLAKSRLVAEVVNLNCRAKEPSPRAFQVGVVVYLNVDISSLINHLLKRECVKQLLGQVLQEK